MCGILLNIGDEEIRPDHPALDIINHRGPDDFGAVSFDMERFRVGLGHRRLSIIDLSERGHQPMSYHDEDLWITYNGEIYNYVEIREELKSQGFSFKTESDTEVLLAAYSKWGIECLHKFNGMFSFCIFDKKNRKLLLVRDRMGIKPLYYFNSQDGLTAVSEIKQLTCFDHFKPTANHERLYHFLNSSDFSYDEGTMWQGVRELEGGHFIQIDLDNWAPGGEIKPERWYCPDYETTLDISHEEAAEEFRRLLQESVKLRLRADVPVGFLLSGGLDSSTLVGLSMKVPREKSASLKAFSSCYPDTSIDESEFINEMLRFSGAESSLHYPHPEDVSANLDKMIWNNDIPIRSGSPAPHWLLYQYIKNDNDSRKVILEGQGADEILCGYRDFFWGFLFENFRPSTLGTFSRELSAVRKIHKYPMKVIVRKFLRLMFPSSVKYPSNACIEPEKLLGTNDIPPIPIVREQASIHEMHKARMTILRYILHNVDRNSMAHSCETRVPFLDHNLIEFCLSLPSEIKINSGLTKQVLRNSMDGVIPEKIRLRQDKQGYSSPVAKWLSTDLKDLFRDSIEEAAELPFVRKQYLLEKTDAFLKGQEVFDPIWWNLITFNRWQKIFKVSI